jgi:gliding motility-associated-like protein
MNHPLLSGKSTVVTHPGFIFYLLSFFLLTTLTLDASAQCNAVITVVKNGIIVEDQNPDYCEGGSITLSAWVKMPDGSRRPATKYTWSNGKSTKDITIDQEGKYQVTVIDANGCSATATVDVTKRVQAQKPILFVNGKRTSGIVEVCDGSSVKLSVPQENDVVFVWEKDGADIPGAGNSNEYTINGPGKYAVRASNSCGSVRSDLVEIKVTASPEPPVVVADGPTKVCQGGAVKLKVDRVDGATYTWKRNGSVFTPLDTDQISTDISGVYTVEVKNTCGASVSSAGVTVEVLDKITPRAEDVEVCMNSNATLKASGGTAGSYRWYTSLDDDTADPSRRDDTYITQILTQDAVFYVAIYNGACEGERKEIKVKVSSTKVANKPTITADGPTKFCQGGKVQLRVPAINGIKYQWKKDGNNFGTDSNLLTVSESGEYTVVLLDACGNIEAQNRMIIDVLPFPDSPAVTDTYSCTPSAFTLKAAGGNEGEYRWYDSQTNPTAFGGATSSTYTTTYLEASKTYYVSLLRDGCESPRVAIKAIISGPPTADAGPDQIINPGESATLQGSGDGSYEWSPATGLNNPTIATPTARPAKTTVYTLRVSRGADCWSEDQVTVIVREGLDIPNAFSPNGDGKNDTWVIDKIEAYPDAKLEVFNRWGSKVYEKIGYQNDWNGTFRGSLLPVGTYFYVITVKGGQQMTGSVSIVQ